MGEVAHLSQEVDDDYISAFMEPEAGRLVDSASENVELYNEEQSQAYSSMKDELEEHHRDTPDADPTPLTPRELNPFEPETVLDELLHNLVSESRRIENRIDMALAVGRVAGKSNREMAHALDVSPPTLAKRITEENVSIVNRARAGALRRQADSIERELGEDQGK